MPRVANPPRASYASPSKQSPVKIPLNDDRQEKAVRFQSRQALHDLQMNQIKAAASPMRKLSNYEHAASSSPKTPQGQPIRGKENREDDGLLPIVGGGAMTPMKRVPILANFEEWMKMATDNKINATNSWNFALIDYFHDMSLLKEGDGVNFQKASCTLDGCVKIYTSRVDSVATETGKLLSGLADSGNKKQRRDGEGEENGEDGEDEEGEDGAKKRAKKRAQRSSEATLAASFASLQLKKFELEFSVDPLFKKASADFDEGGAKGLLLNHLAIDSQGRIVFDSSDDIEVTTPDNKDIESTSEEAENTEHRSTVCDEELLDPEADLSPQEEAIDLAALESKFFPDLDRLDDQDICPSLRNFDLGDPAGTLDIPFLKPPEESHDKKEVQDNGNLGDHSGIMLDDDNSAGFGDDDQLLGGFDMPADTGFGEGGEVWAKDAALEQHMRVGENGISREPREGELGGEAVDVNGFDVDNSQYGVALQHGRYDNGHETILKYFDNALKKDWAGPEHWRIRRMKDLTKALSAPPPKRKEKEPFEIDFAAPLDPVLADLIYTSASSNSSLCLPRTQWKSKTRNLLPDDKHFNSRQLLQLFLKPRARVGSKRFGFGSRRQGVPAQKEPAPNEEIDEAYWARRDAALDVDDTLEPKPQGDYDSNFFQDDGLAFPSGGPDNDDDHFADAREAFSPAGDDVGLVGATQSINGVLAAAVGAQQAGFGSQLVTQRQRLRPEYVQYARVAKKVDVRRLKEEMWKGIGFVEPDSTTPPQTPSSIEPKEDAAPLKFTSVMNSLQTVYPKQAMADISTSYCFICLLHLANEKGLTLSNEEGLEELSIRKDFTAEITVGGD
ncbi:hypothetical protein MMC30_001035 [Trapelia coarctata]|nr:hypothetical protein [Trapelia coarctata]